jgi:hypothetical protein
MFLDKHGINKPVKNFQVNIFILYIFLYRWKPLKHWHFRERFSENPLALKVLNGFCDLIRNRENRNTSKKLD